MTTSNVEVCFFRKRTGTWSARVEWNGHSKVVHSMSEDLNSAARLIGVTLGTLIGSQDDVHSTDAE